MYIRELPHGMKSKISPCGSSFFVEKNGNVFFLTIFFHFHDK